MNVRHHSLYLSAALTLLLPTATRAALVPQSTYAATTAHYQDNAVPFAPITDPFFSDQSAITGKTPPSAGYYALANATGAIPSALGGPKVDGYSDIQGAGFNSGPQSDITLGATSDARIAAVYTVNAPGPGPIDVDVRVLIDGYLGGGNFFSTIPGGVRSSVSYRVLAHSASADVTVFDATATLVLGYNNPQFSSTGDWTAADFTVPGPPAGPNAPVMEAFETSTNTDRTLPNVLTVNPGDQIAIELLLSTEAYADGPFEAQAVSNFGNTGHFSLSSDTPGVTFVALPEPSLFFATIAIVPMFRGRSRPISSET